MLSYCKKIFSENGIDSVIHFAAFIEVGESVKEPSKYFYNNTANAISLIHSCARAGVDKIVFSSTAAVYGEPETNSVSEDSPLRPINPYGHSKLLVEQVLQSIAQAQVIKYVILRYFNVAGASMTKHIGQATPNSTHLIKIASEAAVGKRSGMSVFGDNYDTPDGTCIRDYIHVDDLAMAHHKALKYLQTGGRAKF
ncbi:MAG: UDP-glucose 4-epimerase GalE [Bdellovibrionales bacterium]